jgi:serine O-acetyltransferase
MKGLIESASTQDHQIALLWQAIEKISQEKRAGDCVPQDAQVKECFEAEKLTQLVGK